MAEPWKTFWHLILPKRSTCRPLKIDISPENWKMVFPFNGFFSGDMFSFGMVSNFGLKEMWGKKNGKWWEKYIAQFFYNQDFSCFHSGQKSHQHQDLLAYTFARISLTKGTARLTWCAPSTCPAGAENNGEWAHCRRVSWATELFRLQDVPFIRGACVSLRSEAWCPNYREGKRLSPWPQTKDLNYGELRPRGCKQMNFPWLSRETNLRTKSIFRRDVNNSLGNSKLTKLEPLVEIHPSFPYFMTSHAKRYQRKNYRRNSAFDSSVRLLFLIQVFFLKNYQIQQSLFRKTHGYPLCVGFLTCN